MGDFPNPQQKYAGTGENTNIVIVVIFLLQIKLSKKFSSKLFGIVSTQILNLEVNGASFGYLKDICKISVGSHI